jgi:hypothetical protein
MTKELHPRTQRLHELMRDYEFDCISVAAIMKRSPSTVRKWRCGYRIIPEDSLNLLEIRLIRISNKYCVDDRNIKS